MKAQNLRSGKTSKKKKTPGGGSVVQTQHYGMAPKGNVSAEAFPSHHRMSSKITRALVRKGR